MNEERITADQLEQIANTMAIARSTLSRQFSASGFRDIDAECGYPASVASIDAVSYREMYDKFGIASRVVDIIPVETWGTNPQVYESEDEETTTPFEQGWKDLQATLNHTSYYNEEQSHPVWEYLARIDRMSGIGRFGVLLLGIHDGENKDLSEPLQGFEEGVPESPAITGAGLLFIRAFDESLVQISRYDADIFSARYGQPTHYRITLIDPSQVSTGIADGTNAGVTVEVHWSRVIHVADNLMSSEVYGVPRMQTVYPHLLDLRKLYGGSAEMFWQGAFFGLSFETHPSLGNTVKVDSEKMKQQIEQYTSGLQRYLATTGMTAKPLAPSVADPTSHIERTIEAICIKLGVPKRLFTGSERGELASTQDRDTWEERLADRRRQYCSPRIIRPFVDRLILAGVLPEPEEGYRVRWAEKAEVSPSEKATLAASRMQAVATYIQSGADVLIPPLEFLVKELDYDRHEAQEILEKAVEDEAIAEEPDDSQEASGQEGTQNSRVLSRNERSEVFGNRIVEEDGEFLLYSKAGKILGKFRTMREAAKREAEIRFFKGSE